MLPPKIRGSIPLLEEKLLASISMPTATNGAAKKPAAKRMKGLSLAVFGFSFPRLVCP